MATRSNQQLQDKYRTILLQLQKAQEIRQTQEEKYLQWKEKFQHMEKLAKQAGFTQDEISKFIEGGESTLGQGGDKRDQLKRQKKYLEIQIDANQKKVKQDIINKKKEIEVVRKNVDRFESDYQLKISQYESKQEELGRINGTSTLDSAKTSSLVPQKQTSSSNLNAAVTVKDKMKEPKKQAPIPQPRKESEEEESDFYQ